jgi:hypothetical protein
MVIKTERGSTGAHAHERREQSAWTPRRAAAEKVLYEGREMPEWLKKAIEYGGMGIGATFGAPEIGRRVGKGVADIGESAVEGDTVDEAITNVIEGQIPIKIGEERAPQGGEEEEEEEETGMSSSFWKQLGRGLKTLGETQHGG